MLEVSEEELTQEERLKGLLYQYISLYERWSEDRQVAAKRGADHAELLQQFSAQVQVFKALVPQVQKEIQESLRLNLAKALVEVSEPLQKTAKENMDRLSRELDRVVYRAQSALSAYQASHAQEVKRSQWKVIAAVVVACIGISVLTIQFVAPLGLTTEEQALMRSGRLMGKVFPLLPEREQRHWQEVADQIIVKEGNRNLLR